MINRILDAVAKAHAKTSTYVDAWDMFKDPHGRYADYLRNAQGQLVQMRVGDGVHYMPPAGDVLARTVLHRLNQLYDLTSWKQKRRA